MKKKRSSGGGSSKKNPSHNIEPPMPHEFHKPNFIKTLLKIEHEIPLGMRVLILFSSLLALIYIVLASLFSFTFIFGAVIQGSWARLINIVIIVMLSFMIFGFAKKRMWSYKLANVMFSFVILNSLISMFFVKKSVSGTLTLFVSFSFFFILMMNFVTLWYVRHKKSYFLHQAHSMVQTPIDRGFIYGLTSLWLVFIFMSGVLGSEYYNETVDTIDVLVDQLHRTYPYEVEDYCLGMTDERDLCLLTGAVMYEEELNSNRLCKAISSEVYKYSCFKAIQGDVI